MRLIPAAQSDIVFVQRFLLCFIFDIWIYAGPCEIPHVPKKIFAVCKLPNLMQSQVCIYFGKYSRFCFVAVTMARAGQPSPTAVFVSAPLDSEPAGFLPAAVFDIFQHLPLSVIFVYHCIVVTKKKDRIQTYHSRSCLSPHIEKISMLYRNHDTGLYGQFQAFSGLL